VESCPLTKLDGGLIRLHSADESAVKWLTSHRTWSIRQQQLKGHTKNWQWPVRSKRSQIFHKAA